MVHPHPTEETLEEYVFKRLPPKDVAALEEHLFLCPDCQVALEALDEYILLLKIATAEYELSRGGAQSDLDGLTAWKAPSWNPTRWAPPRPRLASKMVWAGVAMLILLAVLSLVRAPTFLGTAANETSSPVTLAALRGDDGRGMSVGPAHRPFDLYLESGDLPVASTYWIEVVTSSGGRVWDGNVSGSNGKLSAHIDQRLNPGVYWVRLSASSGGSPSTLVREFGLRLE